MGIAMLRSQVYLTEFHLDSLTAFARSRGTSYSALVREALDETLARQAPLDKRALRREAFGAWAPHADAPTPRQLRGEERRFAGPEKNNL